jgi:citrate synthase
MYNHSNSLDGLRVHSSGLDDVVFAETALSDVDGERGELTIRGYPIAELAGQVSFEAVCGLLWDGSLPSPAREAELREAFGSARLRAHLSCPSWLEPALRLGDPMDALRAAVALLPNEQDPRQQACSVIGRVAVLLAAFERRQRGEALIEPDPSASHALDLLRLLGVATDRGRVQALDAYLVTVAEHGMNASTFTARVVASTESDMVSAITAALGALKGKLHGGAPGPVLDMLDAIGSEERALPYLEGELAAGRRIMGMGHRIYRVRDPRAEVLERATRALPAGPHTARVKLALAVERTATALLAARQPQRKLCANVEFFTAVLLEAVGIPRALFTVTFAAARVAGYCAHIDEQRQGGRIVRPASRYVGPSRSRTENSSTQASV